MGHGGDRVPPFLLFFREFRFDHNRNNLFPEDKGLPILPSRYNLKQPPPQSFQRGHRSNSPTIHQKLQRHTKIKLRNNKPFQHLRQHLNILFICGLVLGHRQGHIAMQIL
jgi:hypothetical protein